VKPQSRSYKHRWSRFWRWLLSKDIIVFIMFVGLVAVFWWGRSMSSLRDENIRIQINYSGVAERIAFTTPLPKYFDIKVRDKGRELRQILGNELTITINLSEHLKAREGIVILTADMLRSQLQDVLPGTTTILEVLPQKIETKYVYQSEKKVPVVLRSRINYASEHFQTDEPELAMDSVSIFGSEQALKKVDRIYTDSLIVTDLTDTLTRAISLELPHNIRAAYNEVDVTCFAEQYTDLSFNIPIQVIGLPANEDIRLFPQETKVTVRVGFSNFTTVKKENFSVTCLYPEQVSDVLPLEVTTTNPNISNIRIYPSSIEYIIERKYEENSDGRSADAVSTY
jgi:hypothetical protein